MGKEAAELFYDPQRFMRRGALPGRIEKTLFGQGGVQGLDDEAHRHRKQMFLSLMTPERIEALRQTTDEWWRRYARKWASMGQVVLYDELPTLLCQAVCAWAGVPLPEAEVSQRTRELTALFDQAGAVGPQHWWARLARKRADRWVARLMEDIRAGRCTPPEQSAAHVIAWHRDLHGDLLHPHVAAVELLNVLRPTVAV
jgi:fatty-acid peroxygenase